MNDDLLSSQPSADTKGIMAANLRNAFHNHRYGVFGFWSFVILGAGLLVIIGIAIGLSSGNESLSNDQLNQYGIALLIGTSLIFIIYFLYLKNIGAYLYSRVKSPFTNS